MHTEEVYSRSHFTLVTFFGPSGRRYRPTETLSTRLQKQFLSQSGHLTWPCTGNYMCGDLPVNTVCSNTVDVMMKTVCECENAFLSSTFSIHFVSCYLLSPNWVNYGFVVLSFFLVFFILKQQYSNLEHYTSLSWVLCIKWLSAKIHTQILVHQRKIHNSC